MLKLIRPAILMMSLTLGSFAYADAPVINGFDSDSNAQGGQVVVTDQADGSNNTNSAASAMPNNSSLPIKQRVSILESQVNNLTQLLSQVNQLQSQIQDLRGEVEIQKHSLKVLQDQVRSQYQDLDQRVSTLQQAKTASTKNSKVSKTSNSDDTDSNSNSNSNSAYNDTITAATANNNNSKNNTTNNGAVHDTSADQSTDTTSVSNTKATTKDDDQKAYQAAIALLKVKKYSQATSSFQKFIKQYPTSDQNNDARFWLGQLYLLQGQPDRALEQFRVIIKKDPSNKKMPDILLQTGLAYYAKGDINKAQAAFKKVVQKYPNSSAAKLAQSRLKLIQQSNADQATGDAGSGNT